MLNTAKIFGDFMILQRQKPIKVWGEGIPGSTVYGAIGFNKENAVKAEGVADGTGKWRLTFPSQKEAVDVTMEITDGEDTCIFSNVCIGEVWLAGGQSNMEYPLHFDEGKESVLNGPMNRNIRFFNYPQVSFDEMEEAYDYSQYGFWRLSTKEDLPYFSAVGYYFAEELSGSADLPIGIVGCNWGGTPACAWMDKDYLTGNKGQIWLDEYYEGIKGVDVEKDKAAFLSDPMNDRSQPLKTEEGLAGKILYPGLTVEEQKSLAELSQDQGILMIGPHHPCRPSGLYEAMLKKVAPYTIRGVIWYQGETDERHSEIYQLVFSQMIQCWRDLWQAELPFFFVQLAPFQEWLGNLGTNFPIVRQQQEMVSKTFSNTWMASSSDAGMKWDIHPKNKKPIGIRLALLAKKHIYGEDILADPPEIKKAMKEDHCITIEFNHGNGLYIKGETLHALHIFNKEGEELKFEQAAVQEDKLKIYGDFNSSVTLEFAWTPYYEVNLYNEEHNPVKPFKVLL